MFKPWFVLHKEPDFLISLLYLITGMRLFDFWITKMMPIKQSTPKTRPNYTLKLYSHMHSLYSFLHTWSQCMKYYFLTQWISRRQLNDKFLYFKLIWAVSWAMKNIENLAHIWFSHRKTMFRLYVSQGSRLTFK